jgi:hypothetical protein
VQTIATPALHLAEHVGEIARDVRQLSLRMTCRTGIGWPDPISGRSTTSVWGRSRWCRLEDRSIGVFRSTTSQPLPRESP